jgi:hypothetical protein
MMTVMTFPAQPPAYIMDRLHELYWTDGAVLRKRKDDKRITDPYIRPPWRVAADVMYKVDDVIRWLAWEPDRPGSTAPFASIFI